MLNKVVNLFAGVALLVGLCSLTFSLGWSSFRDDDAASVSFQDIKPGNNKKKVVSFGLYGNDTTKPYLQGAINNTRVFGEGQLFSDWQCRFYVDDSVDGRIIQQLRAACEVLDVSHLPIAKRVRGMFWRFLVASDPTVDRYLVWDADSPLTKRVREALETWQREGSEFLVMRDHYQHCSFPILGGLWGGRVVVADMEDRIVRFIANGLQTRQEAYLDDMRFLTRYLWMEEMRGKVLELDSFSCRYWDSRPFPTDRVDVNDYVGREQGYTGLPIVVGHPLCARRGEGQGGTDDWLANWPLRGVRPERLWKAQI